MASGGVGVAVARGCALVETVGVVGVAGTAVPVIVAAVASAGGDSPGGELSVLVGAALGAECIGER
ncbi:MAG TPA: hypothetical protein VE338_05775 [Ktedonobacterales bacterium]|nr:hypothetical protein [Ktedonobacterales bacterium]